MNLSPSRSSTQGVIGSIGCARASARIASKSGVLRQPLEVAAGREDQLRLAASVRAPALRRRRSSTPPLHSPGDDAGLPSPAGARATKNRVSKRRAGVELGHPAGERHQSAAVRAPADARRAARRTRGPSSSASCSSSACAGDGSGRQADRDGGFLDRLADRRDPAGRRQPELRRKRAVRLVDPPAGKHQRAAGERHALGALDHQQLGRSAGAVAHEHQCRGGDCGRRSSPRPPRRSARARKRPPASRATASRSRAKRGLHALDVLVRFGVSGSTRRRWLRSRWSLRWRAAAPGCRALRLRRRLAAWSDSALRSSAGAALTSTLSPSRSSPPRRKRRARAVRARQSQDQFSCILSSLG